MNLLNSIDLLTASILELEDKTGYLYMISQAAYLMREKLLIF